MDEVKTQVVPVSNSGGQVPEPGKLGVRLVPNNDILPRALS